MLIEVIATNLEEALLAEKFGADRIELIHAFTDGGLSPALELSREVCSALTIPVNVMVRPHAKSFIYSPQDMLEISREIDFLVNHTHASAVVFGSLNAAHKIDYQQLEFILRLLESTQLGLTFHRAIDVADNVEESFYELQNYAGTALHRVLSSGGEPTAQLGYAHLAFMQDVIKPNGVKLLAGSGINPNNAADLITKTKVKEIHLGTGLRINNELEESLFQRLKNNLGV